MMDIRTVIETASQQIGTMAGLKIDRVVGCSRSDQGWVLECEILERPAIPNAMDVLGLYEFEIDVKGSLLQFHRKSSRHRGDVIPDI